MIRNIMNRINSHRGHHKLRFGKRKYQVSWGILLALGLALGVVVLVFSPSRTDNNANLSNLSSSSSSLLLLRPTGISAATATGQATQKVYDVFATNLTSLYFNFLDFVDMSITPDNSTKKQYNMVPRQEYMTLNDAHLEQLVHTGVWIHVTTDATNGGDDDDLQILLLKRGPQLMTCPNMWGLVGEHTNGNETPPETVQRALVEELWGGKGNDNKEAIAKIFHSRVAFIRNITEYPVYYYRNYGPSGQYRVDRQVTYLYEVRLKHNTSSSSSAPAILKLDDEVVDHKWISLTDYRKWMQRDMAAATNSTTSASRKKEYASRKKEYDAQDFCHSTILKLGLFSLERLKTTQRDNLSLK